MEITNNSGQRIKVESGHIKISFTNGDWYSLAEHHLRDALSQWSANLKKDLEKPVRIVPPIPGLGK